MHNQQTDTVKTICKTIAPKLINEFCLNTKYNQNKEQSVNLILYHSDQEMTRSSESCIITAEQQRLNLNTKPRYYEQYRDEHHY